MIEFNYGNGIKILAWINPYTAEVLAVQPRGQRTVKKAFSPPSGKGRSFWRETHLFKGILATVLVVPMIVAGLPWRDVWGGGLSYVQQQTGTNSKSLRFGGDVSNSTTSEGTPISYAEVLVIGRAEGLVPPMKQDRPAGSLGALGTGMIVLVIGLSILLPLVGASLILALILDWLIFRKSGWFQGRPAI